MTALASPASFTKYSKKSDAAAIDIYPDTGKINTINKTEVVDLQPFTCSNLMNTAHNLAAKIGAFDCSSIYLAKN
jgi:hypothetical protein